MSHLSQVHRADRDKDVAIVMEQYGAIVVGPCCQDELQVGTGRRINARDLERELGRGRRCGLCNERILDPEGLPLELLQEDGT